MDTIINDAIGFNPAPPTVMHIDFNSCFASIEQQANPLLRGKPVAVAAYTTPGGCILAASREAKKLGIKTGMRVGDGKTLYPALIVLPPDPNKYRFVNRKLLQLMQAYSSDIEVKSIDEIVISFGSSPKLHHYINNISIKSSQSAYKKICVAMTLLAQELKQKIYEQVGEWLTVSIGIAPNRYLAKIGAGLHKPDGLDVIDKYSIANVLSGLQLEHLTGIKEGYGTRLRSIGITTAQEFYQASSSALKYALHSIIGYHWWLRLHGWEADDRSFPKRSIGHSYALYKPFTPHDKQMQQIIRQLVEKMARRLRMHKLASGGIHVSCLYRDGTFWHHGEKLSEYCFNGLDFYRHIERIKKPAPHRPVRIIAVSCFQLVSEDVRQMNLFEDDEKKRRVTQAIDTLCNRWGEGTVKPASLLSMDSEILDRIAFGGVKDLEEFVFRENLEHIYE